MGIPINRINTSKLTWAIGTLPSIYTYMCVCVCVHMHVCVCTCKWEAGEMSLFIKALVKADDLCLISSTHIKAVLIVHICNPSAGGGDR